MREIKKAIIAAMRAWLSYAFADETAGRAYLQKANHAAISAHRRCETHLPTLTLAVFTSIESGHFDTANELLDKVLAYRSFLKANVPDHYAELCYLYALLEIRQGRTRSARKHWRYLQDANPTHTLEQRVMLGRLHLAMGEYEDGYAQLSGAYMGGCRSPYVYEGLYRYYQTARAAYTGAELLDVLNYATARGATLIDIPAEGSAALSAAVESDPIGGERLYRITQYPPLLKDICTRRIRDNDKSAEAYALYVAAERKQVHVPGLYPHLIQTAYENDAERINHYPLSQFLQAAEMDTELAVYVYHLLLTDPLLVDLLPPHANKILQLAVRCLAADMTGRRVNSLYYYFWTRCRVMSMTGTQSDQAEAIIQENLTRYELTAPAHAQTQFVYITDAAKRGMDVYELPEERCFVIEAADANISQTCLGAGRRSVLSEKMTVRPMVGNVDIETYRYFFERGDRRFYLLRRLADFYMENPEPNDTQVLEAMLAEKNISKPYRVRLHLALGRIHFEAGQYEKALEAYQGVDENAPNLPQRLLQIYLKTQKLGMAASLINRQYAQLSKSALVESITALLPLPELHPKLASAAHRLLTERAAPENMYNTLLDITLGHFPYSQRELIDLIQTDNPNPRLDKRVLEGSLWMNNPCPHAQGAFNRLYGSEECADLIPQFILLCTYKMMLTNFCPEYDTLHMLEKHYLSAKPTDQLLGMALAQTCLQHNLTTLRSDRVIEDALLAQQESGLLLPAFKEHKPAQLPFIEKHQPFLYKGLPDKNVYLNYRISADAPYRAKPMEYLRFGLYLTCLPVFYNEEISYYFSEEMPTGSITTREETFKNTTTFLLEKTDPLITDSFFTINNAIILEQMFKHDQVEGLITGLVRDVGSVRAGLM